MPDQPPIVGRLAPSPTGAQHVGNARTYLIAWLSARARGGKVVLRIEDVDAPRVKPGATEQACADLRWLGLDWDEEPVFQTQRLPHYESALRALQLADQVYPCTCSRSDVERAASAPHAENEGLVYPGTCAGHRPADADQLGSAAHAWRFRVKPRVTEFEDGFRGPIRRDVAATSGDFVVWNAARAPAYQLAVVVDDAAQGVTEVIRGDDLVPSTPRQLLLYEALGLRPPHFAHVPLVIGSDGRRLAKRHGDVRLAGLRDAGVRAEALIGLLAHSCGWIDRVEPVAARDLLPCFRLAAISAEPFVLVQDHLRQIGYR